MENLTDIEITLVTIGLDRIDFSSLNLEKNKKDAYDRILLYNILKDKLNARFVYVSVDKNNTSFSPEIRQLKNKNKSLKPNEMKSAVKLIFQDDDKEDYISLFGTGCCTISGGKMIDYSDKIPLVNELCDLFGVPYPDISCYNANMIRSRTRLKPELNKKISNENLFEVLTTIQEGQTGDENIFITEVPYNEEKIDSFVKIKLRTEGEGNTKNKVKGDTVVFYTGGNISIIVKNMEKCNLVHDWLDNLITNHYDTILMDKEE